MNAFKRAAALTLAAVMLLILAACHGSLGLAPFVMPEDFDTSREYEITFWAKNDTYKAQTLIYEKAITDFQALYPNITVNLRLYTDYGKIYNDVITNISTGTTPNVCITYPDHIATYKAGQNTVVPLDELMADARYGLGGSELKFTSPTQDEITQKFLNECLIDGQYYALPYMRSSEACYVNVDFIEKLGYELPETLTWDFIWEVSEAAMAKNSDGTFALNGQNVMIPFIYKSTDNMMISLLRQMDAGYSDGEGNIAIFNDDTREVLRTVAEHSATGAFSTFKISSYPGNFLNAGQCVFAIDSTAGATWMGANAPQSDIHPDKFVEFNTEVMSIPQIDPENPEMISQGPSVCVFNKSDPGEVMASWLFTQFLLTNEVQIAYSETEGYVPVTSLAMNSAEYQDYLARAGEDDELHYSVKIAATQLLLDNTENTFITPVWNGSISLRDAAGQMVEDVARSVRRKQTVDDAYIDNLFAEMTALYHLDGIGNTSGEGGDMGALPSGAVLLLASLGGVWVIITIYYLRKHIKKSKTLNS
jgi:multiple sugar transport system substrate-binding protein